MGGTNTLFITDKPTSNHETHPPQIATTEAIKNGGSPAKTINNATPIIQNPNH